MNEQEKKMYAMIAATVEGLGTIITKSKDFNLLEASLDTLSEMKDVLKHADSVIDQLVLRQIYNLLKEEK